MESGISESWVCKERWGPEVELGISESWVCKEHTSNPAFPTGVGWEVSLPLPMALLDVVDATLLRGRSPSPPFWERV